MPQAVVKYLEIRLLLPFLVSLGTFSYVPKIWWMCYFFKISQNENLLRPYSYVSEGNVVVSFMYLEQCYCNCT